jgi:hypothetical protein
MPTTQETPIEGYAHCLNARCPGYAQEKVPAIRRETSYTWGDLGGDADFPGFERSAVSFHFADEEQSPCPSCAGAREVTPDPRTAYQNLSGHDPNGLLKIRPGDAPDPVALQAEIAALKEKLGEVA